MLIIVKKIIEIEWLYSLAFGDGVERSAWGVKDSFIPWARLNTHPMRESYRLCW
jgi:hypothetical protein